MTEQQSPQGGALPAWARLAQPIALAAWVLAALAPGVAVALAQYTSLAYGLHSPLYTVALLIVCLGLGLALLGWVFWMVVWVRLRRAGYRFGQSTGCGMLLGSVALIVAGGVLASVGGNGDSVALPALFALGLGVSGVAGGVLGAVWSAGRFIAQSARASQAVREREKALREHLLETASREGYDPTAIRITRRWRPWLILLDLLGTVVGFILLFINPLFVLLLTSLLHLPAVAALLLVLVVGTGLGFVSSHALLIVSESPGRLAPESAVRRYALLGAITLTAVFLILGIAVDTGLWFLLFIPILACIILPPILRKRSGLSAF